MYFHLINHLSWTIKRICEFEKSMNIINRPIIELRECKQECFIVFTYNIFQRDIDSKQKIVSNGKTTVKTASRSIKEFNEKYDSYLDAKNTIQLPIVPNSIRKNHSCLIFSYHHLIYYINRFRDSDDELFYAIDRALKLLTNAMFPVNVVKYKHSNNMFPFGKDLKSLEHGASCLGKFFDEENNPVYIELISYVKNKFFGLTLNSFNYKGRIYPSNTVVELDSHHTKLLKITHFTCNTKITRQENNE